MERGTVGYADAQCKAYPTSQGVQKDKELVVILDRIKDSVGSLSTQNNRLLGLKNTLLGSVPEGLSKAAVLLPRASGGLVGDINLSLGDLYDAIVANSLLIDELTILG